jgi:regulatory protein
MTVTALTPQAKRPHRTSVFVDGAFAFGMDNADLVKYDFCVGMSLTHEQLRHLHTQVLCQKARDTAIRYLSSRPRTVRETAARLTDDGYPPAVVNYALKLMVKYKYLNDKAYAREYAASRLRQGYGSFRIKQELAQKGIKEAYAQAALAQQTADPAEAIRQWLSRKRIDADTLSDPKRRKRCTDALVRRGFSYQDINNALQELI